MKRFVCMILLCALIFAGCLQQSESFYTKPVHFYYPRISFDLTSGTQVLSYELREGKDFSSEKELLEHYFEGPSNSNFYSPFPVGGDVLDYSVSDGCIYLYLNHNFNELIGLSFTIASSCIAMTILSYTGCDSVEINVVGTDNEVERFVTLTQDDILFIDSCTIPPAE